MTEMQLMGKQVMMFVILGAGLCLAGLFSTRRPNYRKYEIKAFFRRLMCRGDCRHCEDYSCKRMYKQKPHCSRNRCIYMFGMGKETIFCENCIYRRLEEEK